MHAYRSHTCGALRPSDAGQTVRLSGWIHRKRDHGNLVFIDIRDHYGVTQAVLDISSPLFKQVEQTRVESVVTITGKVVKRTPETINTKLPTGEIEVKVEDFLLQSAADVGRGDPDPRHAEKLRSLTAAQTGERFINRLPRGPAASCNCECSQR